MLQKKPFLIAILLCTQVLLLSQEIFLQQVLCFKNNGEYDVELAILGLGCLCKDNQCQDHEHDFKKPDMPAITQEKANDSLVQLCALFNDGVTCIDVPLTGNWLERLLNCSRLVPGGFIALWDMTAQQPANRENFAAGIIESIPRCKFIFFSPPHLQNNSVLMRC